jgi:hypothetical protein
VSDRDIPEPIRIIISNEFRLGSKAPHSIRNALNGPDGQGISTRIDHLSRLSKPELEAIIAGIYKRHKAREEARRFYNQRSADADLQYWAKAPLWTIEEAVALSFGKSPEVVNSGNIEPYAKVSDFARTYSRRMELAVRSVLGNKLPNPVQPDVFLKWADRYEEPVPLALRVAIARYWGDLEPAATIQPAPKVEPLRPAMSATSPASEKTPLGKQRRQEAAILEWLTSNGYEPKKLPRTEQGKAGVKAAVWAAMKEKSELFQSRGVFGKAWDRLRDFEDIQEG